MKILIKLFELRYKIFTLLCAITSIQYAFEHNPDMAVVFMLFCVIFDKVKIVKEDN